MIDLGLQPWVIVGAVTGVTQIVKIFVLDMLPLKWGHRNKAVIAFVVLGTGGLLYLNFPMLSLRDIINVTLWYTACSIGVHGGIEGVSRKLKKWKRF